MPIYVYRCPECDTVYEKKRPMDRRNDPVPCCDTACKRVLVPVDFAFKKGWIPTKDGWRRGEGPCDL